MKTLSHREKVLLYVLLLILIVVGGWMLLIQPSITKQKSLTTEYQTLTTTIDSLEITKPDYSTLEADVKAVLEQYNSLVQRYYPTTFYSEDVDSLFTSMSVDYNLKPLDLAITGKVSDPITSFGTVTSTDNDTTTSDTDTTKDTATIDKEAESGLLADQTLICYEVTQRVRGLPTNIYSYIDKVNEDSAIRLTSMLSTASTTYVGQYEATLVYYVYLMVK